MVLNYIFDNWKRRWNLSFSSSSFGISVNNVIMAISINNTGVVTIPAGITNYSTTSQVNTLISNSLTNYVSNSNLSSTLSSYVTSSNLTTTLSNYYINTMSIDYIACINNAYFTKAGTYRAYPYTCQMSSLYSSYCIDCISISGPSEYIIYLPTNFINGQSKYMQCTYSGSCGIGITSTCIILDGSNQQSGFTYPAGASSWLFTYYSPAASYYSCQHYSNVLFNWSQDLQNYNLYLQSNPHVHAFHLGIVQLYNFNYFIS